MSPPPAPKLVPDIGDEIAATAAQVSEERKKKAPGRAPRKAAKPRTPKAAPQDSNESARIDALEKKMSDEFGMFVEELAALSAKKMVSPEEVGALTDLLLTQKKQIAYLKGAVKTASEHADSMGSELDEFHEKVEALNAGMEDLRTQVDARHRQARQRGVFSTPITTEADLGHLVGGLAAVLMYSGAVLGGGAVLGKAATIGAKGVAAAFTAGVLAYEAAS
jgi:hypothetical protein